MTARQQWAAASLAGSDSTEPATLLLPAGAALVLSGIAIGSVVKRNKEVPAAA